MQLRSSEASEYLRKNSTRLSELCSLVDHIQDEDHSQVLHVLNIVAKKLLTLNTRDAMELLGLIERVREHIRFEKTQLFPIIRNWAVRGYLNTQQELDMKRALHSKFVYGWKHILEEFQDLQDGIKNEKLLKNLDTLGEELFWYVQVENSVLFPILTKQLI